MTAPNYAYQPDHECNYLIDYGRREPEREKRPRRPNHSRGGARPVLVNGIHRRRHKRVIW